jgi:hypothetical protein
MAAAGGGGGQRRIPHTKEVAGERFPRSTKLTRTGGGKRRPPIHGSRPHRRGGRSGRQPTDLTCNGGEEEGASEEEGATTALGDKRRRGNGGRG